MADGHATPPPDRGADPPADDPVAAYKALLRAFIDRRPSGTRQKLAEAFGTHKSFISQITNPSYRVPLPAQHIPALFEVCRLSEPERRRFLALYAAAHPAQSAAIDDLASIERDSLRIPLPPFDDPSLRAEVAALIREFAERVVALARRAEDGDAAPGRDPASRGSASRESEGDPR